MAYEFRGKDRRALEKFNLLLNFFRARDLKARDPQKTQALSTRAEIIDHENLDLQFAFEVVGQRVENCLAAEMGDEVETQEMPAGKEWVLKNGAAEKIEALADQDFLETTRVSAGTVDELGCVWFFSSVDPEDDGSIMRLRYTWDEVAGSPVTFRVKAGAMWLDGEIARFFVA